VLNVVVVLLLVVVEVLNTVFVDLVVLNVVVVDLLVIVDVLKVVVVLYNVVVDLDSPVSLFVT
jgi:hypothetical protein